MSAVTECLWAKTFRDLVAAEIGAMLICHRDYADCRGFNPRITMTPARRPSCKGTSSVIIALSGNDVRPY